MIRVDRQDRLVKLRLNPRNFLAHLAGVFLILNHRAYEGYFQDDELDNIKWAPSTPPMKFITGLLYVAPERPDFVSSQNMTDTPLARLTESSLRPGAEVLAAIMETV